LVVLGFWSVLYAQNSKPRSELEKNNGRINKLYWGDNLQVTSHVIKEFRGNTDLIYIGPPFDDKEDYKKMLCAIFHSAISVD